jgi:hypothetical protein
VSVRKQIKDKKTLTTYAATTEGKRAFREHLIALERLIRDVR